MAGAETDDHHAAGTAPEASDDGTDKGDSVSAKLHVEALRKDKGKPDHKSSGLIDDQRNKASETEVSIGKEKGGENEDENESIMGGHGSSDMLMDFVVPPSLSKNRNIVVDEDVQPGAFHSTPGTGISQPVFRSTSSIRRYYQAVQEGDPIISNNPRPSDTSTTTPNNNTTIQEEPHPVVAECIDEDALEADLRQRIIQEATHATSVIALDDQQSDGNKAASAGQRGSTIYVVVLVVCIGLLVIAVGVIFAVSSNSRNWRNSNNNNDDFVDDDFDDDFDVEEAFATLKFVKNRGWLNCGLTGSMAEEESIDYVMCRAIAAAIFGPTAIVEAEIFPFEEAADALEAGELDVVMSTRDSIELRSDPRFVRSIPYMYDGMGFSGVQEFVQCAYDNHDLTSCTGMVICIQEDAPTAEVILEQLEESHVVICENFDEQYEKFVDGKCNVIVGFRAERSEQPFGEDDEISESRWYVGTGLYDNVAVHTAMSRSTDIQWSTFIDVVLSALIQADYEGIMRLVADDLETTDRFGSDFSDMYRNAIGTVGNYGEIWDDISAWSDLLRFDAEEINYGSPLFYPFEIGVTDIVGKAPSELDSIHHIVERGHLNCGIRLNRAGFAWETENGSLEGLDMEYCKAISASLFGEDFVNYVPLSNHNDGLAHLRDRSVDVYVGAHWVFLPDMTDPVLSSFFRSNPYYFAPGVGPVEALPSLRPDDENVNLCIMTYDDPQWAAFVSTVSMSLIYAFHQNITKETAVDLMPEVEWFGSDYLTMLQDAVGMVGNYGEMTSHDFFPDDLLSEFRTRNSVNDPVNPGPQLYVPAGVLHFDD